MRHEDAVVGHRLFGLNWMGNNIKVGFPEQWLEKNVSILTENGYKVAVVE